MNNKIFGAFVAVLIGDLIAISLLNKPMEYVFKPALMLILGFFVYKNTPHLGRRDAFLFVAVGFSWLGDVLLMLNELPNSFLYGLAAFLLAHVSYILLFWKDNKKIIVTQFDRLPFFMLIVAYGIGLFGILLPKLGALWIPVGCYTLVIVSMLTVVLNRWKNVPTDSFQTVLTGAVAFAVSDSLIAVHKFAQPIPFAGFFIMTLYALGQWLIVKGYFLNEKK